ncbi:unnamed protein product [Lampetra planeri]
MGPPVPMSPGTETGLRIAMLTAKKLRDGRTDGQRGERNGSWKESTGAIAWTMASVAPLHLCPSARARHVRQVAVTNEPLHLTADLIGEERKPLSLHTPVVRSSIGGGVVGFWLSRRTKMV